MSDFEKKSIFQYFFQTIEDVLIIVRNEITIAKKNLTYSFKKFGLGLGYIISAFVFINVAILFLLISLAFGFVEFGLNQWLAFLLVALIIFAISAIFILLGFRSFRKIKGIGDASRIGRETTKYISENIRKKN
jgi:phosphoglycerol transferase MdoB-like AlkP superfamily enzyme